MVGLVVIATFILLAMFAPLIAPYDPIATSWTLVRKPPSALHWFGTDDLGRDVFVRVIYGARASLMAGAISVGIALGIGVPLGLLSGYRGGFIDALISRITDAMLACPFLILAIALAAFLGPSLGNAMIAIGITATPIFVRLTRGQVMGVKVEDYVEAARAMGNPRWRIALFHILPNIMPALLVQATLSIAAAIIAEAALSFLGLGQQPPAPSWGSMLNAAQRFLTNAPWMAIWPGLAIFPGGAVVQSGRRRPARRAGSAGAVTTVLSPSLRAKRSDSISTACARMRTMDCFFALLLAMTKRRLNHDLPHRPSAIHLVFEIDHWWPREMPGQPRAHRAVADEFVGEYRMEIVDGVGLRRGRVVPAEAESAIRLSISPTTCRISPPARRGFARGSGRCAPHRSPPLPGLRRCLPRITKLSMMFGLGRVNEECVNNDCAGSRSICGQTLYSTPTGLMVPSSMPISVSVLT